jgi:hypothetical protein
VQPTAHKPGLDGEQPQFFRPMKNLCFTRFVRLLPFWALLSLLGCDFGSEEKEREGLRPIYISPETAQRVSAGPARPLRNTGKIYTKDTLVFVNELYQGIHVINNRDPRQPKSVAFISIPGNVDLAIKGSILYADNYRDLVSLDISNLTNIREVNRVKEALPQGTQDYPNEFGVFFECVDPNKGVVAGWEKATLKNPKCRR